MWWSQKRRLLRPNMNLLSHTTHASLNSQCYFGSNLCLLLLIFSSQNTAWRNPCSFPTSRRGCVSHQPAASVLQTCKYTPSGVGQSKFIMQYLHTSFLQNVLEVCHLSVEMHHRDLLLKHLTVQPHLLQQMDVQLPERYEKDVHRPCKNYATFSFYASFSVTSISKAEMYFSSRKLCVWIFTALPLGSRISFATVHLLLNILKTSNKYHNCTLATIAIKQ